MVHVTDVVLLGRLLRRDVGTRSQLDCCWCLQVTIVGIVILSLRHWLVFLDRCFPGGFALSGLQALEVRVVAKMLILPLVVLFQLGVLSRYRPEVYLRLLLALLNGLNWLT